MTEQINPLSLYSLDDLIEEVFRRFDHAVFVGVKALDVINKEDDTTRILTQRRWKGNHYTCSGLCFDMARKICKDYEQQEDDPVEA